MGTIKKIILSVLTILLVGVVVFGVARGVTGTWNPVEWVKQSGQTEPDPDDDGNGGGKAGSDVITDSVRIKFMPLFISGCWYVEPVDKFSITADGIPNYGRAQYSADGFYGGNASCALKMETSTVVAFETGVPMKLYLWCDFLDGTDAFWKIRIDGVRFVMSKVDYDPYGYTLELTLSAGKHLIQKGASCYLSYLSLTVV